MTISNRGAWAIGLGLVACAAMVAPISGQQPKPETPAPLPPAVIGSIDMEAIVKGYEKTKVMSEVIKGEVLARQKEFQEKMARGQQLAKEMQVMDVNSAQYKAHDAEITELQAVLTAKKDATRREFELKDAEAMASIYKEVQDTVDVFAKHHKMTYVVRISREPVNGSNPDSVMAAMARSVVYFDPSLDMTKSVLDYMNKHYAAVSGGARAASTTMATPGAPATPPAGARPTPGPAGQPAPKSAAAPSTKGVR